MKRRRCPAIVLRRWPYSESSLAVWALTPEWGVTALMAKGAFRSTSGYLGVLDTWALVEIEFGGLERAELWTLYQATLLHRFSGISRDPDHLLAAALIAEIAELAAPPGLPAAAVFSYLLGNLRRLHQGCELLPLLCGAILRGLDLLGLGPRLEGPGSADQAASRWFSPGQGGALPARAPRPPGAARRASAAQLALLRRLRAEETLPAAAAAPADWESCFTMLGEFLLHHLERPPRAWRLLQERRSSRRPH